MDNNIVRVSKSNNFIPILQGIRDHPRKTLEEKRYASYIVQYMIHLQGFGRQITVHEEQLMHNPNIHLWGDMQKNLTEAESCCGQTLYSDIIDEAQSQFTEYKKMITDFDL